MWEDNVAKISKTPISADRWLYKMLVKDALQPYKQSGNSNYSMEHVETISMTFPLAINDSQRNSLCCIWNWIVSPSFEIFLKDYC